MDRLIELNVRWSASSVWTFRIGRIDPWRQTDQTGQTDRTDRIGQIAAPSWRFNGVSAATGFTYLRYMKQDGETPTVVRMPRLSVLLVIWLALLGGGWVLDFFFAARVVGVGCLMLSFVPLVLARNRRLLVCAWVLTTVALVSPLPMRPSVLSDPEEVAGRILAVSVAWGWICVALLEDRWRRRSARSEARLRTVTSVLSSVIWVGDADKRFADPHSEWSDFTGQKREQWHGEGWVSAVHPDDRDRVREMWLAPDPNAWPDRYDLEVRVWHGPSGQYRYVQTCVRPLFADAGELVEWVGVLVDIHDRKMSELAGVESRHRLADAQRLARLGHWEFDVASGIVRVSAELSEAFGGPAKVVSLPVEGVLNIITPDARDAAPHAALSGLFHK